MTRDVSPFDTACATPSYTRKKTRKKREPRDHFEWYTEPHNPVRGEQTIWIAVITQAMMDALLRRRPPTVKPSTTSEKPSNGLPSPAAISTSSACSPGSSQTASAAKPIAPSPIRKPGAPPPEKAHATSSAKSIANAAGLFLSLTLFLRKQAPIFLRACK